MMACFKKISNDALKNVHRSDMDITFNFPWSVALATYTFRPVLLFVTMVAQDTWDCTKEQSSSGIGWCWSCSGCVSILNVAMIHRIVRTTYPQNTVLHVQYVIPKGGS